MGMGPKHKILAFVFLLVASSAGAAPNSFKMMQASVTENCASCSFEEPNPLSGQRIRLQKINVFSADGNDPRHIQKRTDSGAMFSAIGSIETTNPIMVKGTKTTRTGIGQATAFLISPCLVMTNYHTVFGTEIPVPSASNPKDYSSYNVKFSVGGTDDGTGFKYKNLIATPIVWGLPTQKNNFSSDWAILKLNSDQCVGKDPSVGWLDLQAHSDDELRKSALTTAGYFSDLESADHRIEDKRLFRQDSCHAYDRYLATDTLGTDCAFRDGSSGAPIIKIVNGILKVVGIQETLYNDTVSVQRKYQPGYGNGMLPIADIKKEIAAIYGGNIEVPIATDISRNSSDQQIRPQLVDSQMASTRS